MENQHRKIKGYRELNEHEIALMNEIKQKGEELRELCEKIDSHISTMYEQSFTDGDSEAEERLNTANPEVWASSARVDLQTGIMKLVRAVAQPTSF